MLRLETKIVPVFNSAASSFTENAAVETVSTFPESSSSSVHTITETIRPDSATIPEPASSVHTITGGSTVGLELSLVIDGTTAGNTETVGCSATIDSSTGEADNPSAVEKWAVP
jgi:hypothetical protein